MIARLLRALTLAEALLAWTIADALHEHAGLSWTAAGATGIATPLGAHLLIVVAGFALSARDVAGEPLGAAAWCAMVAREAAASVRAFQFGMSWMAWRALPGSDGPGLPGRVPVLLVHGYGCNRQVWHPVAAMLAGRGHAIEAIDLEPVLADIDAYAAPIDAAVRRLLDRTGADRVALVCHSMGGLAARAWLRAAGEARVAAIVTIGSPHRGTRHARLGAGRNAAQMRPDSDWLGTLAASEDDARRRLFGIVLSLHDNIVSPQAIQSLPGARATALRGVGHMALLEDPRAMRAVSEALEGVRSGCLASAAGTPPGRR